MTTASSRGRRRKTQPIAPPTTSDAQAPAKPGTARTIGFFEPTRRHALICEAAYFRAERRGFCPGQELDDWLAAESEIERTLDPSGASS
jgi:hypothetical protein